MKVAIVLAVAIQAAIQAFVVPVSTSRTCGDLDIGCSDICIDVPSPHCQCTPQEQLLDNFKTCTFANGSAPGLLYTTENQLCHMDIPMSRSTVRAALDTEACVNVSQPGEQSLDAFHMDFMPSHHVLERNYNTLYDINDKRFQYVGPDGVVPDPDNICVDWTIGNVYWSQTAGDQIWVSRYGGVYMKSIVRMTNKPTSIAVNPFYRQIYWVSENEVSHTFVINAADLDGSNVTTVAAVGNTKPTSLSVDYEMNKLYYLSGRTVMSLSLVNQGSATPVLHRTLSDSAEKPILTLFGDMYVVNVGSTIQMYTKRTNALKVELYNRQHLATDRVISDISVYYRLPPYMPLSECSVDNGGCDELCLSNRLQVQCGCRLGMYLNTDGKSCRRGRLPDEFILAASAAHRTVFAIQDISRPHALARVPVEDQPLAAAYSPQTGYLYWTTLAHVNGSTGSTPQTVTLIRRVNILNSAAVASSQAHTIKTIENEGIEPVVTRLAVLHSNDIDNIYYLNKARNEVALLSGDGLYRRVIVVGLVGLSDITLDKENGNLYVTAGSYVIRAELNGKRARIIFLQPSHSPGGIALYPSGNEIMWCDSERSKILAYNPTTDTQRTIVNLTEGSVDQSCDLTTDGRRVYWTSKHVGINHLALPEVATAGRKIIESSVRSLFIPDSTEYVNTQGPHGEDICLDYPCPNICVPVNRGVQCICPQIVRPNGAIGYPDECSSSRYNTAPLTTTPADYFDFNDTDSNITMPSIPDMGEYQSGNLSLNRDTIILLACLAFFIGIGVVAFVFFLRRKPCKSNKSTVEPDITNLGSSDHITAVKQSIHLSYDNVFISKPVDKSPMEDPLNTSGSFTHKSFADLATLGGNLPKPASSASLEAKEKKYVDMPRVSSSEELV